MQRTVTRKLARLTLRLGAWAAILSMAPATARAQNNSLLGGRWPHPPVSQPVATTQPARSQPVNLGAGLGLRPRVVVPAQADPPPNAVLVSASPIAVEPPEPRRIEVESLVTIIVRESRTLLNDGKLKSDKSWEIKSELAKWFRLDQGDHLVATTFPSATPGIDFDFENTYEGKGKYDRKDSLTTRITAKVIDVKPNGNLVLEAQKTIRTGDEVLVARLTGECRSEDVTAANTILSTQIANLQIEMPDRGAVRDATRRGWLMRLFDLLRPI